MALSVTCFGESFCTFSTSMCLDDLSNVKVAEWPSCGKELRIRLTICSLCVSHIAFEGGSVRVGFFASVPCHY